MSRNKMFLFKCEISLRKYHYNVCADIAYLGLLPHHPFGLMYRAMAIRYGVIFYNVDASTIIQCLAVAMELESTFTSLTGKGITPIMLRNLNWYERWESNPQGNRV